MTNNNNNNYSYNNRILVVDDEVDITTAFTLALEDYGFKVEAFNDPIQALSCFGSGAYNLVLIDYKMSRMSGLDLYQEIRKVDTKVKVCFITAFDVDHGMIKNEFQSNFNTTDRDEQEEKDLDVKCFIQKPIDIEELVKRIKEELNS